MIIHYPKALKNVGKIDRSVNHVMDIPATIIELAGATYPKTFKGKEIYPLQGRSLVPLIKGQKEKNRTLYFEHEGNRAVRDGKWKAVWTNYSKSWKLFNIDNDRSETADLASLHPEIVSRLSKQWLDWATDNFVEKEKIKLKSTGMPTIYYDKK